MPERKIRVSSDAAGARQKLEVVMEVYEDVISKVGLEMIASRGYSTRDIVSIVEDRIKLAGDLGFGVPSLHGRTRSNGGGRLDYLYSTLVDLQIIPTSVLLDNFGTEYEILIHSTEADRNKVFSGIVKRDEDLKRIWIENDHPTLEGFNHAVNTVKRLRSNGIRQCFMMFDLCHVIGDEALKSGDYIDSWDKVIEHTSELPELFISVNGEPPIVGGFHIPVGGEAENDSMQLHNPGTKEILKEVSSYMMGNGEFIVVFERQNGPKFRGYTRREMLKVQTSARKTFELADECGIVSLNS